MTCCVTTRSPWNAKAHSDVFARAELDLLERDRLPAHVDLAVTDCR